MGSLEQQAGVVLLTNVNRGPPLKSDITHEILPNDHAASQAAWVAGFTPQSILFSGIQKI